MADAFTSSDDLRTARPLRHARLVTLPGPIRLEQGGVLPEITVCYETWGEPDAGRGNAILVCHALSGDSHAARHDPEDDPGWWDVLVGPGRSIDTATCWVVCANVLGGCRGTTGPASPRPDGRPWGADFPAITIGDMVEVQCRLLDHLGITRLRAVIGGSMGGQQAMLLAVRHPDRVAGCILMATAARMSSQSLAFDIVARNAIQQDPNFHGGSFYDQENGPEVGLAIARMLGHITYLSRESMEAKFQADRHRPRSVASPFELRFSVGSYLAYQGGRFVERFDANSYLRLSMAVDLFDLGADQESLRRSFAPASCRWLVLSFSSDWLFPPEQTQDLVHALHGLGKPVSAATIPTRCGHDAFLLPDDLPVYGPMIANFVARLDPASASRPSTPATALLRRRLDLDRIRDLIPTDASVLDLGCGDGALLSRLRSRGHTGRLLGVEIDQTAATKAIGRGFDVLCADLDLGLDQFDDGEFGVVVLSLTLPAVADVPKMLSDMVRVGRRAIVTFPNLGHRSHRRTLAEEGRVPLLGGRDEDWWRSPVIRLFSIHDFERCCAALGLAIRERCYLDSATGCEVTRDPNLEADLAIVVVGR